MKILLLGDASNYHAALAVGLRALGHEVRVASHGCLFQRTTFDIDISRRPGKLSGAALYLRTLTTLAPALRGYDVVQLISPSFLELKPRRLLRVLHSLKRHNRTVFLGVTGHDALLVQNLCSDNPALDYSEWQLHGKLTSWALSDASQHAQWAAPELVKYTQTLYCEVDGLVACLYEYHSFASAVFPAKPLHHSDIPVAFEQLPTPEPRNWDGPVRILIAVHPHRHAEKGIDILQDMIQRIADENPGAIDIVRPQAMPFNDFVRLLGSVHVVCDQLYSYTPATTALMAMALGTVPISGAEKEYLELIGDTEAPIINPDPRDLDKTYALLRTVLLDKNRLRAMSQAGPDYIRRHNDTHIVAKKLTEFWQRVMSGSPGWCN